MRLPAGLFVILLLFIPDVSANPVMIDLPDLESIYLQDLPVKNLPPLFEEPSLRQYSIDKSQDIWHADDPSSYIIPNNELIQYYAKNNFDIQVIYRSDEYLYPDNTDKDVWQNADYTVFTGFGDCEDIAITLTSLSIAKGDQAIVVGGYVTLDNGQRLRDYWGEVYSQGVKSIKPTNPALETQTKLRLEPLYMFNDKISWRSYNAIWYQ